MNKCGNKRERYKVEAGERQPFERLLWEGGKERKRNGYQNEGEDKRERTESEG